MSKHNQNNNSNNEEATPRQFRSLRSATFNKGLEKLPENIQALATETFQKWRQDPTSIKFKPLEVANKNVYSAQIGQNHRALAQKTRDAEGGIAYYWVWIGSHEEYNVKIKNLAEFKKKSNTILENLIGNKPKTSNKP